MSHHGVDSTIRLGTPRSAATYISRSRQPRIHNASRMVAWSTVLAATSAASAGFAIFVEASTGRAALSVHTVRVLVTLTAVGLVGILVGLARDALLATIRDGRLSRDRVVDRQREMYERQDRRISDLAETVSVMAESLDRLKEHIAELMDIRDADIEMATLRRMTGEHYMVVPKPRDPGQDNADGHNGDRGGRGGRGRLRSVE